MQNIYDILGGIGLTVPEDKKADFDKAVNENYKTVAEVDKIEAKRDLYKSQLDETQAALKGYDGVNVEELRGKISTLEKTLADKETEHASRIADMEFNSDLQDAIRTSGAKNSKAVSALLDLNSLKASKNRSKDIADTLEKIKSENDYLFEGEKQEPMPSFLGGSGSTGSTADDNSIRAIMGLPPIK
ncbi:MAG: phage scaffolding protein [Oscillospiraceae bacterium]|nr:phage scaffolding protein [Oscillospiraceae bacterium]